MSDAAANRSEQPLIATETVTSARQDDQDGTVPERRVKHPLYGKVVTSRRSITRTTRTAPPRWVIWSKLRPAVPVQDKVPGCIEGDQVAYRNRNVRAALAPLFLTQRNPETAAGEATFCDAQYGQ